MSEIIKNLLDYLQFPFVQYALIAGTLIALCSSLLGVTLVLKRYSLIGDGLSHVAFCAMACALPLHMTNDMPLTLLLTIACAVLLLRSGRNTRFTGDAAVAMISVASLALGYLIINLCASSANVSADVCSTLFGSTSILTLTPVKVWLCVALSVVVVTFFVLFYHKIFAVVFDEEFARATGVRVEMYNLLLAIVIAVVIVLAMNLVGSLLISALVVFPALSALRVYKSFLSVTICSVVVSVLGTLLGIIISILSGTPVGVTIVAVDLAVFILFCIIGACKGK